MASIGAVIVSETHRGLGLARKMIDTLLDQCDQSIPVVLTATVQGRPVYEKSGFTRLVTLRLTKRKTQTQKRFVCQMTSTCLLPMNRTFRVLKH